MEHWIWRRAEKRGLHARERGRESRGWGGVARLEIPFYITLLNFTSTVVVVVAAIVGVCVAVAASVFVVSFMIYGNRMYEMRKQQQQQ